MKVLAIPSPNALAERARAERQRSRVRGISASQERRFARRLMTTHQALTALTGWDHKGAAARLLEALAAEPDLMQLSHEAVYRALAWLTATRLDSRPLASRTSDGTMVCLAQREPGAPWVLQLVPSPEDVRQMINLVVSARVQAHGSVATGDTFVCDVGAGENAFGHHAGSDRGPIWGYYAVAMQPAGVPAYACVLTTEQRDRARREHEAAWHPMWQRVPHRLGELEALRQLLPTLLTPVLDSPRRSPALEALARAEPLTVPVGAGSATPFDRAVMACHAWAYGLDPLAPFADWDEAERYVLPGEPGVHFAGYAGKAAHDVPLSVAVKLMARLAALPPARRAAASAVERALMCVTLRRRLSDGPTSQETRR